MSKVEIINRALIKLGEPPVSSLNDASFGRMYDMVYNDVRDLLLCSYPWRFAVKMKRLAKKEEKYGVRTMYQLPADYLLLISVFGVKNINRENIRANAVKSYDIVGDCVVTDVSSGIEVEYVARLEEDEKYPIVFREAMAAKLAAEFSMRLKHSGNLKQMFESEFFQLIRQAELNNEIIKDTELVPDNSWVLVREMY